MRERTCHTCGQKGEGWVNNEVHLVKEEARRESGAFLLRRDAVGLGKKEKIVFPDSPLGD